MGQFYTLALILWTQVPDGATGAAQLMADPAGKHSRMPEVWDGPTEIATVWVHPDLFRVIRAKLDRYVSDHRAGGRPLQCPPEDEMAAAIRAMLGRNRLAGGGVPYLPGSEPPAPSEPSPPPVPLAGDQP